MKRWVLLASTLLALLVPAVAFGLVPYFKVVAREFDPGRTFLVQSEWLSGIGCPTNAKQFDGVGFGAYTDPACPTGDPRDKKNEGLLLAKTGPTSNFASAVADIKGVEGRTLTELGYDIRKKGNALLNPQGSHCGAGAPRFNIETSVDDYFVGCSSPPPTTQQAGDGYIRLTWGGTVPLAAFSASTGMPATVTGTVRSLQIVFDEGYDTGPDFFGMAVLDNINVNGTRVGLGTTAGDDDEDDEHEDDGDRPRPCDDCKKRGHHNDD